MYQFSNNKNERIARKKNEFIEKSYKKTNYIFTKSNQVTSIGTSLIPFLEHNDANRSLMGSNMQKQAIPLINKENALVQTGTETKIGMESSGIIRAKKSGIIKYKSANKIIIQEQKNTKKLNENHSQVKKNTYKILKNTNVIKKKKLYTTRIYKITKNRKSNQNLYITQHAVRKNYNWIKQGEILTNNSHIKQNKLCLGKNLLVAYMPLEGYNFEDAIVISRKLIEKKAFSSLHMKKHLTFITDNEMGQVRKKN